MNESPPDVPGESEDFEYLFGQLALHLLAPRPTPMTPGICVGAFSALAWSVHHCFLSILGRPCFVGFARSSSTISANAPYLVKLQAETFLEFLKNEENVCRHAPCLLVELVRKASVFLGSA